MGTITTIIICAVAFGLTLGFMGYCYSTANEDGERYW